jgi:hypothetical protein
MKLANNLVDVANMVAVPNVSTGGDSATLTKVPTPVSTGSFGYGFNPRSYART